MFCPKCKKEVDLDYYEDDEDCPNCGHGGWWEEEYTDDNHWMVWYWDEVREGI
jgi:uncharacterized CHY-type Zn-finger protein